MIKNTLETYRRILIRRILMHRILMRPILMRRIPMRPLPRGALLVPLYQLPNRRTVV